MDRKSPEVTSLLDGAALPRRAEIERLRAIVLDADPTLAESVKWNGPSYASRGDDRVTMRVQPPGTLQLILHRGARKLAQPAQRLIADPAKLLAWKENDRAVVTIRDAQDLERQAPALPDLIARWISAAAPPGAP